MTTKTDAVFEELRKALPHDAPRATEAARRAHHAEAAKTILNLATAQVRSARDLGGHAARMGIEAHDNPFRKALGHDALASAWFAGHREAANGLQ